MEGVGENVIKLTRYYIIISLFNYIFRHLKTVILGETAVGKTTFVHRYQEKQFKETISVCILIISVLI